MKPATKQKKHFRFKTLLSVFLSLFFLTACDKMSSSDEGKSTYSWSSKSAEESPAEASGLTSGTYAVATDAAANASVSSLEQEKKETQSIPSVSKPEVSIKIPEKIRKTAYLNISVEDYKKARTEIEKIVKTKNGYIGSENEQNSTYSITNDMVIRVKNKDFDAMVNGLLTVASHINSKNISAEDVTAQFVDIQSRLRSKKEIEKRYLDILQKAAKVSDILEIEQKIGEIREEIEAKEGELKYLSDQVDYSTIHLNFNQAFEYTPTDRPGFFGRLGNAFGNGWSGLLTFLVGVVYAWPVWLILGLTAYFLVKFIKRKLKK